MCNYRRHLDKSAVQHADTHEERDCAPQGGRSRRDFLITGMAGIAAGTLAGSGLIASAQAIGLGGRDGHLAAPAIAKDQNKKSLVIEEQGDFYVGGKTVFRPNNLLSSDPAAPPDVLPGDLVINQMYVEFQIPAERKHPLPVNMASGNARML